MNRNSFENKVLKLIPSKDLKAEITATRHKFTDLELLKIIDDYSPALEEKLSLFKQAGEIFTEKKSKIHAKKLVHYYNRKFEKFIKTDENAVYDIDIKCNPNDCEEIYFTKTYDGALALIKNFLKYYKSIGAVDNKLSRYTITKRSIKFPQKPSDIEGRDLGECVLGQKLKVLSVDYYSIDTEYKDNCKYKCSNCKHDCLSENPIYNLPPFLKKYDLVAFPPKWKTYDIFDGAGYYTFKNSRRIEYGIVSYDMGAYPDDDCACILFLNSRYVKDRTVNTFDEKGYYPYLMQHEHVPYPDIEKVDKDDVPEEVYSDYLYTVEQLKKFQ